MLRRDFFSFAAGGAALPAIAAEKDTEDECDRYAGLLAKALAKKHGSDWVVKTDPQNAFVLLLKA